MAFSACFAETNADGDAELGRLGVAPRSGLHGPADDAALVVRIVLCLLVALGPVVMGLAMAARGTFVRACSLQTVQLCQWPAGRSAASASALVQRDQIRRSASTGTQLVCVFAKLPLAVSYRR